MTQCAGPEAPTSAISIAPGARALLRGEPDRVLVGPVDDHHVRALPRDRVAPRGDRAGREEHARAQTALRGDVRDRPPVVPALAATSVSTSGSSRSARSTAHETPSTLNAGNPSRSDSSLSQHPAAEIAQRRGRVARQRAMEGKRFPGCRRHRGGRILQVQRAAHAYMMRSLAVMSGAPGSSGYRPPRFEVASEHADGTMLLRLTGELDLVSEPVLAEALAQGDGQPLRIDLSELAFMDSTGLRALLGLQREHADVKLRGPLQPPVQRLLELTQTLQILPFETSRRTAPTSRRAAGGPRRAVLLARRSRSSPSSVISRSSDCAGRIDSSEERPNFAESSRPTVVVAAAGGRVERVRQRAARRRQPVLERHPRGRDERDRDVELAQELDRPAPGEHAHVLVELARRHDHVDRVRGEPERDRRRVRHQRELGRRPQLQRARERQPGRGRVEEDRRPVLDQLPRAQRRSRPSRAPTRAPARSRPSRSAARVNRGASARLHARARATPLPTAAPGRGGP